jgi:hypothetical protein
LAAAAAARHRSSRVLELQRPTHKIIVDLVSDEILLGIKLPQEAKNAKEHLSREVAAELRRAYDGRTPPAEPRGGSALLSRWQRLQTKKGREELSKDVATLKEALSSMPGADLSAVVPVNGTLLAEFRPRAAETVSGWVLRVNRRIPSQHLFKDNRAQRAAKGELKAEKQGDGVLQQAFKGEQGKGARTSEFASKMVMFQASNRLPTETAVKSVRGSSSPRAMLILWSCRHVTRPTCCFSPWPPMPLRAACRLRRRCASRQWWTMSTSAGRPSSWCQRRSASSQRPTAGPSRTRSGLRKS